jgi:predicted NBD/HSP70 family sugar kinase
MRGGTIDDRFHLFDTVKIYPAGMPLRNRPSLMLTEPQKRVLLQLRIGGSASRIHLAQALGTNGATMTRLSQQLIALGLIEEMPVREAPARGRPMVPIGIAGGGGWSVGATVHPGWLELVIVDFSGRALIRDTVPFDSPDPLVFARTLDQRLRSLAAEHGFMRGKFLGLGVAVPGYALRGDRNHRCVVDWLSGWSDVPLAEVLGDVLAMPVWIENDATAAALAEYYQHGLIGAYRSVLVLFLGHGIGGGLIVERDLLLGEHGNVGEVGRLFPANRPRPSGIDLLHRLREAGVAIDSLSDIDRLQASHAGLIAAWIERVAHQLDYAVLSGTAWLDPGAVVISGALPLPILRALATRIEAIGKARDTSYRAAMPKIHASPIGSAAVVIGAAMVPIHAITTPGA